MNISSMLISVNSGSVVSLRIMTIMMMTKELTIPMMIIKTIVIMMMMMVMIIRLSLS